MNPSNNLAGVPIYVNDLIVSRDWIFPVEKYFEWEEKDKATCIKLGIGHWGPSKPAAIMVGGALHVHPAVWKQMKSVPVV